MISRLEEYQIELSRMAHGTHHAAASSDRLYSIEKEIAVLAPLRFVWNATRGHRLAPWRSEYLKWRIETYSGKKAEALTNRDIFNFLWESKWELLSFLAWTGQLDNEVRRRG